MIHTTVRVERPEGTVVATNVPVQIEQAEEYERVDFDGARPYDRFWIYTHQWWPSLSIQRRDLLFDLQNTDPETGVSAKYRVAGVVETFAQDHQEMECERVVGG